MEAQASVLGSCHPHSFALLFLARKRCGKRYRRSLGTRRKWRSGDMREVEDHLPRFGDLVTDESESSISGCRRVAVRPCVSRQRLLCVRLVARAVMFRGGALRK